MHVCGTLTVSDSGSTGDLDRLPGVANACAAYAELSDGIETHASVSIYAGDAQMHIDHFTSQDGSEWELPNEGEAVLFSKVNED